MSAAVYREIQWGRAPDRVVSVHLPGRVPAKQTQLGVVVELVMADGRSLDWPGQTVRLCVARPRRGARRALYLLAEALVRVPAWARNQLIAEVVYHTRKGGRPQLNYRHGFEGRRPKLTTYRTGEARIERAGSRYDVTERGIEG